jgi:hypothetical protein
MSPTIMPQETAKHVQAGRFYTLIHALPSPGVQGIIEKTLGNCMALGPKRQA